MVGHTEDAFLLSNIICLPIDDDVREFFEEGHSVDSARMLYLEEVKATTKGVERERALAAVPSKRRLSMDRATKSEHHGAHVRL